MEMNKETLEKMSQMRLQGMYYAFKTSLERMYQESTTLSPNRFDMRSCIFFNSL
ncbi:hypothetical protein EZS27_006997 [termite gut metagenome]|uniref:Uncharacterized protein n=1 Tax=termite gut metagenome TaxID=433724 RepID=A0A5J4SGW3_9ZZZZ